MEFYLTSKFVCPVGYNPIPREIFEKWLLDEYLLEDVDLPDFWGGRFIGFPPEDLIQTYVRFSHTKTVFDDILNAIRSAARF